MWVYTLLWWKSRAIVVNILLSSSHSSSRAGMKDDKMKNEHM